ncbi:secretory calcium-binding phosphoprotein 5 isoform X2 [Melanotaenia boesemani]|uniref:secretory calcium-binding phosphoprotein 5 isoform X2 n=1 Tax=Melanotaenia boesemani TaxID=1250792 RepID=UPI001C05D032|nr:secretory calcium-binding phosphoprotein 5 isoform X2 [Melanotaenia boesemani]
MKLAILCLCLASTASAVPYQYLPHYTASRPQAPSAMVKNSFAGGFLPGLQGGYSVEFFYPHRTTGGAGLNPADPNSRYGLVKYSIPQPPGRQSVEIFYPYDFAEQRVITSFPPMSNGPVSRDVLPFGYPPQNVPQQNTNIQSFDPSQDPAQQLQQDQPTQTSQVSPKM